MNLSHRLSLLSTLRQYLVENNLQLQEACEMAHQQNVWFEPVFVKYAIDQIAENYLSETALQTVCTAYGLGEQAGMRNTTVGIIMAGNIPLVGFHDFLCAFLAGVPASLKPSSKDTVLIKHILEKLCEWEPQVRTYYQLTDNLRNHKAYIATGSNNSSRYFEYYFRNYAHIIRKNRTSAAVIRGNESEDQLALLAHDALCYFGLGCRSVTHLYVPANYNFEPLLKALSNYSWMKDHSKFRNNYDYNLSIHLLNGKYYMTDGNVLLIELPGLFSPIAQINYSYYDLLPETEGLLKEHAESLQCVVDGVAIPFGGSQKPGIMDYADGEDTLQFLLTLS